MWRIPLFVTDPIEQHRARAGPETGREHLAVIGQDLLGHPMAGHGRLQGVAHRPRRGPSHHLGARPRTGNGHRCPTRSSPPDPSARRTPPTRPSATTPSTETAPTADSPPAYASAACGVTSHGGPDTAPPTSAPATGPPPPAPANTRSSAAPTPDAPRASPRSAPRPPAPSDADTTTACELSIRQTSPTHRPGIPPQPHVHRLAGHPDNGGPRRSPRHRLEHLQHRLIALLHQPQLHQHRPASSGSAGANNPQRRRRHRPTGGPSSVSQVPGPLSPRYRGRVPKLSARYRCHSVKYEPGPHNLSVPTSPVELVKSLALKTKKPWPSNALTRAFIVAGAGFEPATFGL